MNNIEVNAELLTPEFRSWFQGLLREDYPITVTFTKKDGTERVMKCTKSIAKIPIEMQPSGEREYKEDENVRVFDLEKNEWRSFNYSSVKRIEFTIGDE